MASGDTKTQQYLDIAANGTRADLPSDNCCNTRTQSLIVGVAERIMDVEDEVEEMKNNPDVADIVATYADLQAYDTSKLTDKDVIRVLQDENHDGASTYYRWDKGNNTFTFIGEVGDYYTKGQVNTLLGDKQNKLTAGANISIDADNEISATDTTYSNFTGTDGTAAGTAGLVPAPATTDADKFLKSDGTWDTAGGGGGDTVYSDKSTSNTSTGGAVYIGNLDSSQVTQPDPTATDNHYRYLWALPQSNSTIPVDGSINILGDRASQYGIALGGGASGAANTYYSIAIGLNANTDNSYANSAIAIGQGATVYTENSIGIGRQADIEGTANKNSVALGSFAKVTRKGELNIGTGGNNVGYNNTDYRVIGGVHDGQNNHDAATVAQGNTLATSAPTTSTVGVLGQLYTDTTGMHTYQCTAISGDTYTWTQRW